MFNAHDVTSANADAFYYMHPERAQYADSLTDSEDDRNSRGEYLIAADSETGYQTEASGANSEAEEATESEVESARHRVYLALPKTRGAPDGVRERPKKREERDAMPNVNSAERTTPQTRTTRRLVFDGVHLPTKEAVQNRPNKQIGRLPDIPQTKDPPAHNKEPESLPEIRPVDARKVRFEVPQVDMDMPPAPPPTAERTARIREIDSSVRTCVPTPGPTAEEPISGNSKTSGRQSDLQTTIDVNSVLDRLLNLSIPLSVGEAFALSKEIRNGIQDRIRMKNVKAVLIGRSVSHPILANWNWQRSEGILIKVEMETGGRKVFAIIDTGSQLDVVRADIAALVIHRPVDMSRVTNMNDANGGRGQLRGLIDEVEFNCGGVITKTDLWVSQQAPFELLLGRPWQRSNLVTIDERDEGTYLVFKDPDTRKPRYELLAIPHEHSGDSYHFTPLNGYAVITEAFEERQEPAFCAQLPPPPPPKPDKLLTEGSESAPAMRQPCFELLVELIQLARIWLAIVSLGSGYILLYMETSVRRQIQGNEYKGRREDDNPPSNTESTTPPNSPDFAPTTLLAMTSPAPHSSSHALPSEIQPGESQVLNRLRFHQFGPRDAAELDPNDPHIVQRVADQQWDAHMRGEPPHVRPGFLAAPQTVYLGYDVQDEQETHYGVMINARMLLHNPLTGLPGCQNGHAYFYFKAAPEHPHTQWSMEVPYAEDRRIHAPVSATRNKSQDDSMEDETDVSNGDDLRRDPFLAYGERSACAHSARPLASAMAVAGRPIPRDRGLKYVHFPADRIPPFATSHMQQVGTTNGEPVLKFRLSNGAPTSAGAPESPARFDTPIPPYKFHHTCPPLDSYAPLSPLGELELTPLPNERTHDELAVSNTAPDHDRSRSNEIASKDVPVRITASKEEARPRYPIASDAPEILANVLANSTMLLQERKEDVSARLRERKRKAEDPEPQPPVMNDSSSAADRLSPLVFRARGAPISRAQYSSSSSSNSEISVYEPLAPYDDAMTERSACSSDEYIIDPREVITRAATEARRQLDQERSRPVPFVGMLMVERSPSLLAFLHRVPESIQFRYRSALIPGDTRPPVHFSRPASQASLNDNLYTWASEPDSPTNYPVRPPLYRNLERPLLPGGRPTESDEELERLVQSPRPRLPFQRRRILNELQCNDDVDEVPTPEYPSPVLSPASDDSMPGLQTIYTSSEDGDSPMHEARRNFYALPNATFSTNAEPSHTPNRDISDVDFEYTSTEEIMAEIAKLRSELPYNEEECRAQLGRVIKRWHHRITQRILIAQSSEDLHAMKPFEDALFIFLHELAALFNQPAMALGDLLSLRDIALLSPDTPAEDIIRARGRLVCSFIDVNSQPPYPDSTGLTLEFINSISYDEGDRRRIKKEPDFPPSPHGERSRERRFNGDALRKGAVYLAACKAEYYRQQKAVSSLSNARLGILEGLHRCEKLVARRGWPLDLQSFRWETPGTLPLLQRDELAQLRLLGDAFNVYGNSEVFDIIDRLPMNKNLIRLLTCPPIRQPTLNDPRALLPWSLIRKIESDPDLRVFLLPMNTNAKTTPSHLVAHLFAAIRYLWTRKTALRAIHKQEALCRYITPIRRLNDSF
ncbi:hypothetical protein C8J57DRAFT_1501909 [Mycena rebaudengoi]|nr:hypothetical protein C8J57DRAFT_1501909 [Mycena rebaudengoi]